MAFHIIVILERILGIGKNEPVRNEWAPTTKADYVYMNSIM